MQRADEMPASASGQQLGKEAFTWSGAAVPVALRPGYEGGGAIRSPDAFVLADLGIAHHPRADHAAYVASWLRVLKDDPRAIFTAASKAQAAADWMHAQQPQPEELAA